MTVFDLLGGAGLPPGVTVPQEWDDFALMKEMGWSWRDLTGQRVTPHYVAECCRVFLSLMNRRRG